MGLGEDFQEFWANYPRRVGKIAAEQAYLKARKKGATQEQILRGIAQYVEHKPAYADFCHPRTWLAQGRWLDEYQNTSQAPSMAWWDECKELHHGACDRQWVHHQRMRLDAVKKATA